MHTRLFLIGAFLSAPAFADEKPSAVAKRLGDSYERWSVVKVTDHVVQDEHYRKFYEIDDGKGEYLRDEDVSVTLPGPRL